MGNQDIICMLVSIMKDIMRPMITIFILPNLSMSYNCFNKKYQMKEDTIYT